MFYTEQMSVDLLNSPVRAFLKKQADRWTPNGAWRIPSVCYTLEHKLAYLAYEHYLTGRYSWAGIFHDWDKPFLYLIPFVTSDRIQQWHRRFQPHHLSARVQKRTEHLLQTYIDWECALWTKPDKPLNAYATLLHFYPDYIEQMIPVLLAVDPQSVTPQLVDADARRKSKMPLTLAGDKAYNRTVFKRVQKVIRPLTALTADDWRALAHQKTPKKIANLSPAHLFIKTLIFLANRRGQHINFNQIPVTLRALKLNQASHFSFTNRPHVLKPLHDRLSHNPFLD